ncbi:cation diffusion facilitator family transporter [uncultured Dialister sp.]|uniref:cation diffusion facilitator family transporter n=1 Tax=uncultured Dialister sp. TaxID=278064 RepID=UPI0025EE39A9|nr:cation diffusion facilitator family transporter [uncultured Dialister sp.]
MNRNREIVKVSIQGAAANVFLAAVKAGAGLMANSIAVVLDGLNNLSDAFSSLVTIAGTLLAGRAPDREYPYGFGRIEYFTSAIIAVIVLLAGAGAFKESLEKVMEPPDTHYSMLTLGIIVAGILVKLVLGKYVIHQGRRLKSQALTASGTDALSDAILSSATLVSAILNLVFGWNLEGILGLIISVFILKAGYEILKDTLDHLIGLRIDDSLSYEIKSRVTSFPGVLGAYDLEVHNYGPARNSGSVHIEVADAMTARDIQILTRKIMRTVLDEFGVFLTIGIYASNKDTETARNMRRSLRMIMKDYPHILQIHGFYVDEKEHFTNFDLVFSFDEKDRDGVCREIEKKMKAKYPDYDFLAYVDLDYSS